MNKSFFILFLSLCMGVTSVQAQLLKNIRKKIEQKAEQVADRTIDNIGEAQDKSVSAAEGQPGSTVQGGLQQQRPSKIFVPMAYDFARRTNLIFEDSVLQEETGRMAPRWTSNGTGALTAVD